MSITPTVTTPPLNSPLLSRAARPQVGFDATARRQQLFQQIVGDSVTETVDVRALPKYRRALARMLDRTPDAAIPAVARMLGEHGELSSLLGDSQSAPGKAFARENAKTKSCLERPEQPVESIDDVVRLFEQTYPGVRYRVLGTLETNILVVGENLEVVFVRGRNHNVLPIRGEGYEIEADGNVKILRMGGPADLSMAQSWRLTSKRDPEYDEAVRAAVARSLSDDARLSELVYDRESWQDSNGLGSYGGESEHVLSRASTGETVDFPHKEFLLGTVETSTGETYSPAQILVNSALSMILTEELTRAELEERGETDTDVFALGVGMPVVGDPHDIRTNTFVEGEYAQPFAAYMAQIIINLGIDPRMSPQMAEFWDHVARAYGKENGLELMASLDYGALFACHAGQHNTGTIQVNGKVSEDFHFFRTQVETSWLQAFGALATMSSGMVLGTAPKVTHPRTDEESRFRSARAVAHNIMATAAGGTPVLDKEQYLRDVENALAIGAVDRVERAFNLHVTELPAGTRLYLDDDLPLTTAELPDGRVVQVATKSKWRHDVDGEFHAVSLKDRVVQARDGHQLPLNGFYSFETVDGQTVLTLHEGVRAIIGSEHTGFRARVEIFTKDLGTEKEQAHTARYESTALEMSEHVSRKVAASLGIINEAVTQIAYVNHLAGQSVSAYEIMAGLARMGGAVEATALDMMGDDSRGQTYQEVVDEFNFDGPKSQLAKRLLGLLKAMLLGLQRLNQGHYTEAVENLLASHDSLLAEEGSLSQFARGQGTQGGAVLKLIEKLEREYGLNERQAVLVAQRVLHAYQSSLGVYLLSQGGQGITAASEERQFRALESFVQGFGVSHNDFAFDEEAAIHDAMGLLA